MDVRPLDSRRRRSTRLMISDGLSLKLSPFVVEGIKFECTYATQISLKTDAYSVREVSISGSTEANGDLTSGFSLNLVGPQDGQIILGRELSVRVDWQVKKLKKVTYYFQACQVVQVGFTLRENVSERLA